MQNDSPYHPMEMPQILAGNPFEDGGCTSFQFNVSMFENAEKNAEEEENERTNITEHLFEILLFQMLLLLPKMNHKI